MSCYDEIYEKIKYTFKNEELIKNAFMHPSYNYENNIGLDNQRMEFLGDAVLALIISDILYKKYAEIDEGKLSKMRSALVNKNMFAQKALEIDIDAHIMLSSGEENTGGRARQSNLADCFEAVIGALYLDGGYEDTYKVIEELFIKELDNLQNQEVYVNYKSFLQEYLQKQHKPIPEYKLKEVKGESHKQIFMVELYIGDKLVVCESATSKKEAEKRAAKKALENMGIL
ncbi:MAG: ribonuclease III [Eubacteriaceae bacterium]|nr:ribonuclease III [Eubacteriaceae bacterium]